MSKFVSGVIGATALVISVGAAQFAVGQSMSTKTQIAAASAGMVNRAVKADRPEGLVRSGSYHTIVTASDDASVAMRSPKSNKPQAKIDSKPSKRPVACEASASVLTEIARSMDSARCVT